MYPAGAIVISKPIALPMKRLWLLFSQSVTVLLAALFVVSTLKPQWLQRGASLNTQGAVPVVEAPQEHYERGAPDSFRDAAQKAAPAVVSINSSKTPAQIPKDWPPGSNSSAPPATRRKPAWARA